MTARIPLVINSGAIQELQSGDNFNLGTGATLVSPIITGTGTAIFSQVNIVGQGDLRLEDASGGQYVALQAPATIAASFTLTLPIDDGTSGQALITDGAGNLSWSTSASGDVYGPASATDNAVARFDGTTGKIIQNSVLTIGDDGASVLSVNSASDGLRITQTGAGNALVVEDSANPDATPFVINTNGQVIVGDTSVRIGVYSNTPAFSISGTSLATSTASLFDWANNSFTGPGFLTQKSKSGTAGTHGIVASGDRLFLGTFSGSDGTAFIPAAAIEAWVDGTPGTNDMPGRLVFGTTADGASSPTERMRIDSAGRVSFTGSAPSSSQRFIVGGSQTLGANPSYFINQQTIQSDATGTVNYYQSYLNTQTASFTTTFANHYYANQGAIGAGSAVTSQRGFVAENSLTGATNNYGFYSNIASGTGRYNFYAAGTADNYFAGAVGIGNTPTSTYALRISKNITGGAFSGAQLIDAIAQSDVTSNAYGIQSRVNTAAAAFTLGDLIHFYANPQTLGAGSTVTRQYGFHAESTLTGATNNYGFYSNIASGTGRYNFYAAGTASNYFAGPLITAGLKATSAAAPTIASATTIAPTTQIVFVSGTTAIATITAPAPISTGGGQITIIPTGLFTTTTAGNIALASIAVVSKALIMTYDTTTAKWYPSY